jgi:hypothetical protein
VVGGWEFSGVLQLTSGLPLNVTDGQDISHTGIGLDRPNTIGNPNVGTTARITRRPSNTSTRPHSNMLLLAPSATQQGTPCAAPAMQILTAAS